MRSSIRAVRVSAISAPEQRRGAQCGRARPNYRTQRLGYAATRSQNAGAAASASSLLLTKAPYSLFALLCLSSLLTYPCLLCEARLQFIPHADIVSASAKYSVK